MDISNDKLDQILFTLFEINKRLDVIEQRLSNCEFSCKNMDDHINFVENTYSTLRSPLDYIRTKFNYITGTQSEPLPNLRNNIIGDN